ncbi:MAG: NAD(P)H:quinone oxidoreductase [Gammaproteobacteria bacterium]|nr:NAD(P)H:quinone oxidoreductase [Gammaproteobacteria bacterium]MDE0715796.1 NAD(P)H:quinone oxidoreductase [Gammaproteobacteria bacterium]MXY64617.1 NAD(P)H:quinone oxidoreductase [Gammaproteobacteria bacterium]MYG66295.1 NAD(P)H:quinone oxidoreductase [Gammaproteobacteria bacterium]MYH90477.1 NAD(P)H:quinone oxidoreductase [Gammaproteobacteria bacterium]
MTSVLVLYYSRHGSVAELASQVAYGVESVDGCEAVLRTVPPVSSVAEATAPAIPEEGDVYAEPADLMSCDALVLGSPTRFGTVASPIKYFFDQTAPQWLAGTLKDKPAGVFTSTTSMHGGQESTLLGMMLPLIHHGMVMVGLPFSGTALSHTRTGGTPYGASHVAGADNNAPFSEDEVRLARLLGSRVANAAVLLKGSAL